MALNLSLRSPPYQHRIDRSERRHLGGLPSEFDRHRESVAIARDQKQSDRLRCIARKRVD